MAGYHVSLRILCPRPSKDDLLFLKPLRATAQYLAGRNLHVGIEIEADDMVAALARANELVLGGISGEVEVATVAATDGMALPPGRLFRRKRNT